jgi:hypothetical protein
VFTTIEGFGSTSLGEDGSNYFLSPNGGSPVELRYAGAPVVAGQFDQFGGHWVPIGAEQTANGYESKSKSDLKNNASPDESFTRFLWHRLLPHCFTI